jgi:hypothetical protein
VIQAKPFYSKDILLILKGYGIYIANNLLILKGYGIYIANNLSLILIKVKDRISDKPTSVLAPISKHSSS